MGPRHIAAAAAAAGATLLFIGIGGAPQLTLQNDAISIDYPAHQGLALLAVAGLAAAAARRATRPMRYTLAALAVTFVGLGAARLSFSVVASGDELRQESLFGKTVLPWAAISKVELGAERIVAWGAGDEPIRIGTTRLTAAQRASLERTISRRVHEASTPPASPTPAPGADAEIVGEESASSGAARREPADLR